MRRRDLPALLLAAVAGPSGCAVLMDIKTRRVLVSQGGSLASRWVVPPGSTLKPFSLLALLETRKLKPDESYFCPGRLTLAGRRFDCIHPAIALPMNPARAIAYSCNCAVAHFAQRFDPGELARLLPPELLSDGLSPAVSPVDRQLQALGETRIAVSALGLLAAYRRLALRISDPVCAPILEGLEGAVEFGTAQAARLNQLRVAGKTGSVITSTGAPAAWFAGFAPSREPQVAVVSLEQARSGGSSAAPIAGDMLRRYFAGRSA